MKTRSRKSTRDAQAAEATSLTAEVHTVRRIMAQTPDLRTPVHGAPCRCPDCGVWGMVDEVTPTATASHCSACQTTWVVTRRAVAAVQAAPAPVEVSGGVLFMDPPRPTAPVVPAVDNPRLRVERIYTGGGTFVRRVHPVAG